MKSYLVRTALAFVLCFAFLCCKSPTTPDSAATLSTTHIVAVVTVDTALALHVAAQYQALAKTRPVTAADYATIAANAVDAYSALQTAPPPDATVADWLGIALKAVAVYDAAQHPNP